MSKKHFIQLANSIARSPTPFTQEQINIIADFCQSQNPRFDRDRFLHYIKTQEIEACSRQQSRSASHSQHC
jgi:hypothetical protein